MFYTPNKTDFVQNINLSPGLKQTVDFGRISFDLKKLKKHDLTKENGKYFPLIISINYQEQGRNYAFINYCIFVKDSNKKITGVRGVKQIVLVSSI